MKMSQDDLAQLTKSAGAKSMKTYPKIQSIYKRDPVTKHKTFLSEYSTSIIEYLADKKWVFTEKVDGTNIRLWLNRAETSYAYEVLGRTSKDVVRPTLTNPLDCIAEALAESWYSNELYLPRESLIIFGEGYGPKIQKGGANYRKDPGFVVFDIFDPVKNVWYTRRGVELFCQEYGLDIVPVIGSGTLDEAVSMCSDGFASTWGDFQAEGIIAFPECELRGPNGDPVKTKVKCCDFRNARSVARSTSRV